VFFLTRPSPAALDRILAGCANAPLTYAAVGATRGTPPAGYYVDRYDAELGLGAEAFARARAAVDRFVMYPRPWTEIHRTFEKPHEGAMFVALIHHLGFWSANPSRIIYTVDETGAETRRYGFALGTVAGHAETGEERFEVSWDTRTDMVSYRVVAFSRPYEPLARLGTPIARALQRRFGRQSRQAMTDAVSSRP
jgi:uncharacterized protein (UPF0548 family)